MENCMEVVIDRDAFVKGLQMVQNIVEPRQTLPILANVLLEADGEAVRVTATDLEVGARVTIPAKVASKGAITVSTRKLGEIVKELPAAAVALRVTDNVSVSLRCAGATYKLVGLAPDDFPPVVPASPASWVSLEGKTLREMLAQTCFAISHDETRYALNGILFVLQGKDVQMVATDGRSEEHTSELQSLAYLVCRLLLEKKKKKLRTNAVNKNNVVDYEMVIMLSGALL